MNSPFTLEIEGATRTKSAAAKKSQPKCGPYQAGEVKKSYTAQGHLRPT